VRARLADAALSLNAAQTARQALAEYLNIAASPRRARSVEKIGWHQVGGRAVFVLPGRTFGSTAERVVLQTLDGDASATLVLFSPHPAPSRRRFSAWLARKPAASVFAATADPERVPRSAWPPACAVERPPALRDMCGRGGQLGTRLKVSRPGRGAVAAIACGRS